MGDWPQTQECNPIAISTGSPESIGVELSAYLTTSVLTTAWPTANLALYVPFVVHRPWTVLKMLIENGATVGGNVDVGVYDGQQNRILSSGSTAHAGASGVQTFDVTDTLLVPGAYFMAVTFDNNTSTIRGWATAVTLNSGCGVLQQASAFALPSPAVFAACASAFVPFVTLLGRTLV